MLRLFYALVMCLLTHPVSHPVGYKAAPVEESPLQLTTAIIQQRFCEGDGELDGLDFELGLLYRNSGTEPLILYNGSDVYGLKVSRSIADAEAGKYEVDASITWVTDGRPWRADESSLGKIFVILGPGEVYEARTQARVFVTRPGINRRIAGAVSPGDHYLQVTIPMWHGSAELAESLGKKWGRKGFLWTKAATSLPMAFIVESNRVVAECN